MNAISSLSGMTQPLTGEGSPLGQARVDAKAADAQKSELRSAFDSFVGEVFFGQMMESMRKTVGKPAYMHGGRGEEVFQQQLDQVFSEKMTEASASSFSEPMFELFQLGRQ